MTRHIVLLRGINLGPRRRIPMARLRELLGGAGFEDVRTYVQSGNVVLTSSLSEADVARECSRLTEREFGFAVPVVARSRDALADVVQGNPLAGVASDPKRLQVTFLERGLDEATSARLSGLAAAPERLVVAGRELYSWHPHGIGRSALWGRISSEELLGVTGTARNWTTVTTLLAMADER